MRFILTLVLTCTPALANAEDQIAVLKDFCEKNQADSWAKNSESCRLVRGEYKLDQLCEGYAKGNTRMTVRLQSIADKFAELKAMESDAALQQLCAQQIGPEAIAAKPECADERDGKQPVTRKWWDGKAWVTTKESPPAVKAKADNGDPTAQFNLGYWYLNGADCIARDTKVAVKFFCQSYDKGYAMANVQLVGVGKDEGFPGEKAREGLGKRYGCALTEHQKTYAAETKKLSEQSKLYLKRAEAGDIPAMIKAGEAYLNGDFDDGKGDSKLAFQWFKKAADKGSAEGMSHVGTLYNRGDGVEQDHGKAFQWNLKAAQKGDVDSEYFIGLCFYDGQGVEKDMTKAVQWLVKAMDHGHSEAQEKLAEMYLRGELQAVAFKSLSDRLKKLESKK